MKIYDCRHGDGVMMIGVKLNDQVQAKIGVKIDVSSLKLRTIGTGDQAD